MSSLCLEQHLEKKELLKFLKEDIIGASLIAANISAEQIIGMGTRFVVGMAIATGDSFNCNG